MNTGDDGDSGAFLQIHLLLTGAFGEGGGLFLVIRRSVDSFLS